MSNRTLAARVKAEWLRPVYIIVSAETREDGERTASKLSEPMPLAEAEAIVDADTSGRRLYIIHIANWHEVQQYQWPENAMRDMNCRMSDLA